MDRVLGNFILALRSSGVRISVSETLDAMQVAQLVGYSDRQLLKTSLGSSLAKSLPEKELFEHCFERYFTTDIAVDHAPDRENSPEGADTEVPLLAQLILSGNMPGLAIAMGEAGNAVDMTGMQYFTQKGLYIRRIQQRMGMDALGDYIRALQGQGGGEAVRTAERLEEGRSDLAESVRNFVERQFDLYSGSASGEMLERYLRNMRLSNLEQTHYHQMQAIIQRIVKQLRDLHSRRKKGAKRGQLDFKKTLRNNISHQGLLFDRRWKMKKLDRPKVMVICDVSRSVSTIVRFFLLILYSMNELVDKIRTFILCSNLVEVTDIFEKYALEEALVRLQTGAGLDIWMGRTDYGQSLRDFWSGWGRDVTKKTTVIILGDARSNYGEPEVEILKKIQERCKQLIWLNPETPSLWGSGDSEMRRYLPFCHMARECSTLNHLEKVMHALL